MTYGHFKDESFQSVACTGDVQTSGLPGRIEVDDFDAGEYLGALDTRGVGKLAILD